MQVERVYQSIALGCPRADSGVIETNIGRDIRDRKKMGTFPYRSSRCILLPWQCILLIYLPDNTYKPVLEVSDTHNDPVVWE